MRYLKRIALAMVVMALFTGYSGLAQAGEWKGWNIHKAGYPNTTAMDKFAELLSEKSKGRLTLKMYHSGVLGSQPDAIEQLRIGGLEIGNFNMGPVGPVCRLRGWRCSDRACGQNNLALLHCYIYCFDANYVHSGYIADTTQIPNVTGRL